MLKAELLGKRKEEGEVKDLWMWCELACGRNRSDSEMQKTDHDGNVLER